MRRSLASMAVVATIAIALPGASISSAATTPAPLGTAIDIGLTSVEAMVVDAIGQRVFVSSWRDDLVRIVDFTGSVIGTLPDIPRASGMAIVDRTLYVVAGDADRIEAYDLAVQPPEKIADYPTTGVPAPYDLQYAGGKLWLAGSCRSLPTRYGWMSLETHEVSVFTDEARSLGVCSGLDGGLEAPGVLFVVHNYQTIVYDVSGDVPVFLWQSSSGVRDISLFPDGGTFLSRNARYRTADGTVVGSWDVDGAYPNDVGVATAVTGDRGGLVAAASQGHSVPDVWVWRFEDQTPASVFDFPATYEEDAVWWNAMAFSPDASRLFVITGVDAGKAIFRVVRPDAKPPTLTIEASREPVTFGRRTRLDVHLEGGTSNREVEVYGTPYGGRRQLVASGTVDGSGDFSAIVAPSVRTGFEVVYDGDEDWYEARAAIVVRVRMWVKGRLRGSYARDGEVLLYRPSDRVVFVVAVAPPHEGKRISLNIDRRTPRGWRNAFSDYWRQSSTGVHAFGIGPGLPRGSYRVSAITADDRDHLGARTERAYFRVT